MHRRSIVEYYKQRNSRSTDIQKIVMKVLSDNTGLPLSKDDIEGMSFLDATETIQCLYELYKDRNR